MQPALIQDKEIDRVEEYKYLGTIFDTTLKFLRPFLRFAFEGVF